MAIFVPRHKCILCLHVILVLGTFYSPVDMHFLLLCTFYSPVAMHFLLLCMSSISHCEIF